MKLKKKFENKNKIYRLGNIYNSRHFTAGLIYNEFGCQTIEPDRTKSRCCNFIRLIENPFIEKVGRHTVFHQIEP